MSLTLLHGDGGGGREQYRKEIKSWIKIVYIRLDGPRLAALEYKLRGEGTARIIGTSQRGSVLPAREKKKD